MSLKQKKKVSMSVLLNGVNYDKLWDSFCSLYNVISASPCVMFNTSSYAVESSIQTPQVQFYCNICEGTVLLNIVLCMTHFNLRNNSSLLCLRCKFCDCMIWFQDTVCVRLL